MRFLINVHQVPFTYIGQTERWIGIEVPLGWVEADGQALKRKEYPVAATIIQRKFGTSWWMWHMRKRFCVPDLRTLEIV